jgi:hypothetical protein
MFTFFNVPGSLYTNPYGINNKGQFVGNCLMYATGKSGFVHNNGTFTIVNFPGAERHVGNTYLYGINDSGQLTGPFF